MLHYAALPGVKAIHWRHRFSRCPTHLLSVARTSSSSVLRFKLKFFFAQETRIQSYSQGDRVVDRETELQNLVSLFMLSFLASQNRSLFAAKCMIETVIELYLRGYNEDDIKLTATFHRYALKPIDLDIVVAWAAVIMTTLRSVGVRPQEEQSDLRRDVSADGLQAFVDSCIAKFREGLTSYRLSLQQSMSPDDSRGVSPSVIVLQQNTRLAVLTLEMVRDFSYTDLPHSDDDVTHAPIGLAACVGRNAALPPTETSQLAEAAKMLLICFNGSALCHEQASIEFVRVVIKCYKLGFSVDQLFSQLHESDFEQSGGVIPFGAATDYGQYLNITSSLFGRCISVVYMTLAQLGIKHPGAVTQVGWAWGGTPGGGENGAVEAYGLADFVASALKRVEDEETGNDDAAEILAKSGGIEDAQLARSSSFAFIVTQLIQLVRLTRSLC